MRHCILALILLINTCFVMTSHAGTNDLIFNSGFEPLFFVGGNTTTSNVVLKLNQYDDYTIFGIGAYVIPYPVENGSDYTVEVVESSGGHLCSVQNNTGVISNNDVMDVNVFCGLINTIYDVKQENVSGLVAIENLIVTECKDSDGYWVQTIAGDADYMGDDYSGSYVNKNDMVCSGDNADAKVGDRVTLNPANANNFFGQVQMAHNSLTILSSNNVIPQPVITAVNNLSGLSSVPLEGVLVKVENLLVTHVQLDPGNGEPTPTNNFAVNNLLLVDDILYLTQPFPEVNDTYDSITGISIFRHSQSKLLPRYSQDVYFSTNGETGLVINEVDYNQPGDDENEFIEIFNPTNSTISLASINLYLINGNTSTDYSQYDLSSFGSLLSGQYLVIGSSKMIDEIAPGALTLDSGDTDDQIQNGGPNGDGVVLFDQNLNTVIDSLSYGADILSATLTDINMVVNVTENSFAGEDAFGFEGSISRSPNGQDTNNNSQDFGYTATQTPGAYNVLTTTADFLVINEFDYDMVGTDDREFIEIYNPTMSDVSLANISLYLINGSNNTDYLQIELGSLGILNAGQYLVIGSSNMLNSVAQGALTLAFDNPEGQIQNGTPEGMVLFDKNINARIDSLSYEGNISTATLSDLQIPVSVTEGTSSLSDSGSTDGGVSRIPNGQDFNNNDGDFEFTETLTPGAANILIE